jgi:hypothetical protein
MRKYHTRVLRFHFAGVAAVIVVVFGVHQSTAQDAPTPARKDSDRATRFNEMKQIAGSFHMAISDGGTRTPTKMVQEPLYRWSDPTRDFSDGTLWFWKSSGRPIAVVAVELYPQNKAFGTVWALEFTSLATGPIDVEGGEHFDTRYADLHPPRVDGSLRWAPQKGGVEFREIPQAPLPATTEAERLRQMKDLVKRLSAREFFQAQSYTLRLVSHPIDRYAEAATGLMDGAIFIYANGTNPEVLLLIEARRREGLLNWSYAAAPLARASVTLSLDQEDVWTHKSKDVPSPEDTYFLARRRRN